jgi:type VI secretion system protein VasJ
MPDSCTLSAHCLKLAQASISEVSFAGEDVRFSNEYEALESELSKAQSMHDGGPVDWLRVREQSETLLATQSKDLRVGAWLTWALYQLESFPGLVAGIGLLHELCANHWSDVHPVKQRTRCAAINWLVPRIEQVFDDTTALKDQSLLCHRLAEVLERLDEVFARHLDADAPLLLPLSRRIQNLTRRAATTLPQTEGASPVEPQQIAAPKPAPASMIETEKDAHQTLRLQQERARHLCEWWLKQKVGDLRALRLNRSLPLLLIESVPESNAEQVTALRGLPADRLKTYQDKYEQRRYADLLVELEASLAKAPFWFDGQRMVWECLHGLQADTAMREVELHFAVFLHRLPDVTELRFHDGVPFADAATKAWIAASVTPRLQSAVAPRTLEIVAGQFPWECALGDALSVLDKDGLRAAVHILKLGAHSAHGERARFFWQLALARLCFTARRYELAKTQLETLDQTLEDSGLDAWEPDLAVQVLELLHGCYALLSHSEGAGDRKEQVYRRLCHLDLEWVLEQA